MVVTTAWVEKYRPKDFDNVVGQEHIVEEIRRALENNNLPLGYLFVGRPGVGKTTLAFIIARYLHGDNWREYTLVLNASDERGIETIRVKVKDFASTISPDGKKRVIILDEADKITDDAQHTLRRTIEEYSDNALFILTANEISKIIEPLQSRLVVLYFRPLISKEYYEKVKGRIKWIAENEGVVIEDDAVDTLLEITEGDLRKAINLLQRCAVTHTHITSEVIEEKANTVTSRQMQELFKHMEEGNLEKARDMVVYLMYYRGQSPETIIKAIGRYVTNNEDIPTDLKLELLKEVGEKLDVIGKNPSIEGYVLLMSLVAVIMDRLSILKALKS